MKSTQKAVIIKSFLNYNRDWVQDTENPDIFIYTNPVMKNVNGELVTICLTYDQVLIKFSEGLDLDTDSFATKIGKKLIDFSPFGSKHYLDDESVARNEATPKSLQEATDLLFSQSTKHLVN